MAGPLQTPYHDATLTDFGAEGDLPTARGNDPLIDMGGTSAADPLWDGGPFVPTPGSSETANSVSALPALPARFQPSDQPPSPPDLTDRTPGTIDQR